MCVFTHSKQPLEKYEAPLYFPPVEMNHALLTKTFRSEWDVPIEKLRKGLMKGQLFQQMLKYTYPQCDQVLFVNRADIKPNFDTTYCRHVSVNI